MAVKSLIHVIIKFVFFLTPKLLKLVPPCAFPIQLDIKEHHHCSGEEGGNPRMTPFWAKTFFGGGGGGSGKEIKFCMLQVPPARSFAC